MIASTLVLYLALYAFLIAAYIGVIFHLARKPAATTNIPSPAATLVAARA
jgi:cytochrome d ubiquinol oxidase subunit I